MRFIYLILICFAMPVAAATAWLRGIGDPSRRERLRDRLGAPRIVAAKPVIWVHAASMGEVQAGAVLIRRLLAEYATHQLVVTTQTATGAARVAALFGDSVQHCYLPYDVPFAVNRFLKRSSPRLALILETELWPNLLTACKRRGIPIVVASGRISPRSFPRYRKLTSLFKPVLSSDVVIAAQTDADAERFRALGATDVRVLGNIKFDIDIPAVAREAGAAFRAAQGTRFIWVAGSTHSSEEDAALVAHRRLMCERPDALLVLVPRHPQRFEAVKEILRQSELSFVTRSSGEAVQASTAVLLVDTMGELLNFYAAADLAFVGGSLAPVGGHNLLEPAALNLPVIAGPHLSNAQDVADRMTQLGAVRIVKTTEGLGDAVLKLCGDVAARSTMSRQATEVMAANGGTLHRLMKLIAETMTAYKS